MQHVASHSLLAFPILATLVAHAPAGASGEWTTMASPTFTFCLARVDCTNETPCLNIDFNLPAEDCSFTICVGSGDFPCISVSDAHPAWHVFGHGEVAIPDVPPGTSLSADGELDEADQLTVSGSFFTQLCFLGTAELAVLRYFGDPSVFRGLDVGELSELIDLGLIEPEDVLLFEKFGGQDPEVNFSFEVDIAGLPPEEIVVFTSGSGREGLQVPGLSEVGKLGLVVMLLAAAAVVLLRR